ncbi:MAG TPA: acetylornithine transaminase [Candidatus Nanopelagicaceae bacterium]
MIKSNKEAARKWQESIQQTYATPTVALRRGRGVIVEDFDGKKYLDLIGGIATNLLGHAHPSVNKAISKQAKILSHTSNLYAHEAGLKLAKRLVKMTGENSARVYFCNSGAEAIEAAIKLSRLTGKKRLVSAIGSFHGRTTGALSLTGQSGKRDQFKPLLPKVSYLKFGDFKEIKRKITKRTAMVFIEPIMGEAGVVVPPTGYLKEIRMRCDEVGALLAIDCIQTGMGRTGEWFGYESEGIRPDVITVAKGLGGGLPLGAMIAIGDCAGLFTPGSHGSTFGGNPISCAAANAVLDEIEKRSLLIGNKKKGELFHKLAVAIPGIVEIRGRGLLIGVQFEGNRAKEISKELQNRGFLVNSANEEVIRIAPSYLLSENQIKLFVTALKKICENIYV